MSAMIQGVSKSPFLISEYRYQLTEAGHESRTVVEALEIADSAGPCECGGNVEPKII
jgi:hypothetical protein